MPLFRTLTPRHRRLVAGLTVLSVGAIVWAVEFDQQQWRVNSLYAAITAGGGTAWVEAPLWRKYVASWRRKYVYQATQVELKGEVFDDQWLRDHDDLTAFEIDYLRIEDCPLTATGLNGVLSKHPIEFLSVMNVNDADAFAGLLADNQSLLSVHFCGTDLSDAGFRKLPLKQLDALSVHGTRVTPTGLLELQRCRHLGCVCLDGQQFDEHVAQLLRMQGTVSRLFLFGEHVTDEHLSRIQGTSFQFVTLTDTVVTPVGVSALRLALPHCRIYVDSTPKAAR